MAILGIDEVGRGPWAGPLVIGAVILPENKPDWVNDLNDSKKLTVKKRESLNEIILKEAPATGLGWVSSAELDEIGLANSLKLAARRAVEEVRNKNIPFQEIIIDGTQNFLAGTTLESYVTILKKADFLIKEVSAASIIAKVARDHYMYDLAQKFPAYGFEKHVGYGTATHQKALETFGPCPEHRQSFRPIQNLSDNFFNSKSVVQPEKSRRDFPACNAIKKISPSSVGGKAESVVRDFLESRGHQILARNHKTKFYEIDIISTKDDKIYFTEVKYRASQFRGTSLDQITKAKLSQMTFAAESFLKFQPELKSKYNPILAAAAVSGPDFHLDDWFVLQ